MLGLVRACESGLVMQVMGLPVFVSPSGCGLGLLLAWSSVLGSTRLLFVGGHRAVFGLRQSWQV